MKDESWKVEGGRWMLGDESLGDEIEGSEVRKWSE